jgi:hypothetical protein
LRDGAVKRFLESQARSRAVAAARLQDITLFDREGKAVSTVGEPGIFNQAALSPDGTRVAVIKSDRQTGNADVCAYEIATGKGTAITSDAITDSSPPEVYTVAVKPEPGTPVQITKNGAIGGLFWRQDGKELFFLASPGEVLSAIDPTAAGSAEQPLFKIPPMLAPAQVSNIATRDGQRFVFLAQRR